MLFRQFLQSWKPVRDEDEEGCPEMNKEPHGGVRAKDLGKCFGGSGKWQVNGKYVLLISQQIAIRGCNNFDLASHGSMVL
jgi:hypothetical protein